MSRRRFEDDDDPFDTGDLRRDARSEVATRVLIPAIILIVANALALLGFVGLFLFLSFMLIAHPPRNQPDDIMGVVFAFGFTLIGLVVKFLVLGGAIQMARMRMYPIAIAAAVLEIIPCGPCGILELPVGIYALVILLMPDVREAFYLGSR
jgi:hypothetical protein